MVSSVSLDASSVSCCIKAYNLISFGILNSILSNISPVSNPSSISIDVTPVFSSPLSSDCCTGDAPLYCGKSEACKFIQGAISIIFLGNI